MARPRKSGFHLPKYLTINNGSYWYRPPKGGKAIRLAHVDAYEDAIERYRLLVGEVRLMDPAEIPLLLSKVKRNSESRGLEVRLTKQDLAKLWERSQGRCELSGVPFETVRYKSYRKRPWAPSVDRIDSARGYEPGNVRLVCAAMNYALNEWGEEVFAKLAIGYVQTHGIRPRKGNRPEKATTQELYRVPPELLREFGLDPTSAESRPLHYQCRAEEHLQPIALIDAPSLGDGASTLNLRRLRAVLYAFKNRRPLAPVQLARTKGSPRIVLVKGLHRYYASVAVGFTFIPARFVD